MEKINRFEDLNIWKQSVELSVLIYSELRTCKDFGFRDQIQRASVSIPSNISEGFDRNSNNEFIRFLKIAKGSCAEVRTQLIIGERIGFFQDANTLVDQSKQLSAMIQKMINYREQFREK